MDVPLEVYQSQAILLHILDTCLTGYWQHQMNDQTAPHQTDIPRLWPDPPALDDYTARSLLNVVTVYLRALSAEADTSAGTASTAPNKDDRGQSASTIPWGHGSTQQSRAVSLSREFLQAHSFGTWVQPTRHVALFDVASLTSMAESLSHTTRYIGHIIFYLSSSNWPLVLARIKFRLSYLTTTIEDTPDLIELRLLQWSNLDRARLGQVMQEASKIFLHIKRPSQLAFASVIHSAIWNWVNFNSGEFDTLVSSEQRMEGDPEVLFDALYGMSDFSSSHAKRTAVFYPLLAMILVICPDMLKEVVGGKAANKSSGLSKKYSFMESLKKGLSSGKGFEPSAACYVDFLKAAVRLSPRHGGAALRILLPELIHDLQVSPSRSKCADYQDSLFFGSHSKVLVESGLPVEGLVALYSADPVHIGSTVFNRLWLDSDISRAIAIQACAWTVAEGDFLPWRPTITSFRSEFAGSVRQVFRVGSHTMSTLMGRRALRPILPETTHH
jgi:neurofibromin 1